jgi:hypothetical protein
MQKARKLKTIQKQAKDAGLLTLLTTEPISQNAQTGKIVRTRGRKVLTVYDDEGKVFIQHHSGAPRITNNSAEERLNQYLQERIYQKKTCH